MTVYVDDMHGRVRREQAVLFELSHLFADSSEELREFAAGIGLQPEWLRYPGEVREHYLVTNGERVAALAAGAQPLTFPRGTAALLDTKRRRIDQERNR